MKNEIWKNVKNYENIYQISNLGRVKSLERTINDNGGIRILKEKILKQSIHYHGYLYVILNKKKKYVHRLVAEAFLDNQNNYKEVNHKDGNKQNNRVDNLEWCTRSYNVLHSYKTGLLKAKKGEKNGKSKAVMQYDLQGNFIKKWECIKEASKQLKIADVSISSVCKNKTKTAGNYKWEYVKKEKENKYE